MMLENISFKMRKNKQNIEMPYLEVEVTILLFVVMDVEYKILHIIKN